MRGDLVPAGHAPPWLRDFRGTGGEHPRLDSGHGSEDYGRYRIATVREAPEGVEAVPKGNVPTVPCEAVVLATERDPVIEFLAGSGIVTEIGI